MGWIFFASTMMILSGIFHIFTGIGGIAKDDIYVSTSDYFLELSVTTWGWVHLLLGIVILVAGFSLFKGAVWARTIGVILAGMSMFAGFAWLPYLPIWGITIVVIAMGVLWALTTQGRDV